MRRRVIGNLIILAIIFAVAIALECGKNEPSHLSEPFSASMGKVVATAFHQALSDPYFSPLEKLTGYLDRHPGMAAISVDMLSKWSPDDEIPTCFVWNADGSKFQLDHGADPAVIDKVVSHLQKGLLEVNPNQLLYLKFFRVNGEKFWLGFIRIPLGSAHPTQMAGAFFSMDRYLERDVPRLLIEMIDRPRFPLARFQSDSRMLAEPPESDLSMRIVKEDGEVYFQRGRTFDPDHLIYAESQFYPKPVVALMEGWDLQIFSAGSDPSPSSGKPVIRWGIIALSALLLSILWWFGSTPSPRANPTPPIMTPPPRPGRGIRLDKSKSQDDDPN